MLISAVSTCNRQLFSPKKVWWMIVPYLLSTKQQTKSKQDNIIIGTIILQINVNFACCSVPAEWLVANVDIGHLNFVIISQYCVTTSTPPSGQKKRNFFFPHGSSSGSYVNVKCQMSNILNAYLITTKW